MHCQVFFILFRETLETSIIVSVLLAFLKQTLGHDSDLATYKKLRRQVSLGHGQCPPSIAFSGLIHVQVWLGTILGLLICVIVGAGLIGAFYGLGKNKWSSTQDIWEGAFSIFASLVISIMGAALLRVSKLQDKWRVKLAKALEVKNSTKQRGNLRSRFKLWCEKYALFILPFITVLREGLEAVIFMGGVSLGLPATSFPLAVVTGLACGCLVGYFIYRSVETLHKLNSRWLNAIQGRQLRSNPDLLDHLNLLLIFGRCRPLLQSRLEPRDAQGGPHLSLLGSR